MKKEYKTKHDLIEKMIHKDLRKRLKFVNTNKLLWPRKGSLMKTQTRILDNRLYYNKKDRVT